MLRKMSDPRLLLTMARTAEAIGANSSGTSAPCISRSVTTRSARFTARSPMRSRSLVIFRAATTSRISSSESEPRRTRRVADASELCGFFRGATEEPHLIVGKRAAAKQPDGVFVDDDFHFVDAGF